MSTLENIETTLVDWVSLNTLTSTPIGTNLLFKTKGLIGLNYMNLQLNL